MIVPRASTEAKAIFEMSRPFRVWAPPLRVLLWMPCVGTLFIAVACSNTDKPLIAPETMVSVEFGVSADEIDHLGNATLEWSSVNADSLVALGDWSGRKRVPSGQETIGPFAGPDTLHFSLTAYGGAGSVVKRVTVRVQPPPSIPGVWRFRVLLAVTEQTVAHYGGLKAVSSLARAQIDTVNARFNRPGVFASEIRFVIDSLYMTESDPFTEACKPHPLHEFRLVIDGFPTSGGGWLGSCQAIYHSWPVYSDGGPFGAGATDGLVHEWGHARGAIDLYALQVHAQDNPINGQEYRPAMSIMTYPYGVRIWDRHSVHVINHNAASTIPSTDYITKAFPPSIELLVADSGGQPINSAAIEVYPVRWFSNEVVDSVLVSGTTDASGTFKFTDNPFGPNAPTAPWHIRYCNLLIKVTASSRIGFAWLPLDLVQIFHFENVGQAFSHRIVP